MFKQPRVPQRREGTPLADFVYELTLFLKDFCMGAWQESKKQREEIEAIKKQIAEMK